MVSGLVPGAIPPLVPFVGYAAAMPKKYDHKAIVAENVATLLRHAQDKGYTSFDSAKRLAKKAGLGHMTIYRMLRGEAAKLDELEAVACVFKLHAWQLLIPELDPINPPVVPLTTVERRFYAEVKRAAKVLTDDRNDEEEMPEGDEYGNTLDRHHDRQGASGGRRSSKAAPRAATAGKKTRAA